MRPDEGQDRAGGNFFEDFAVGQEFRHATPRTVTPGDTALYMALTGNRFALNTSAPFARACGLAEAPLDDILVLNLVAGRAGADIALNARGNLGYAEMHFGACVYPGDTLTTTSRIIGLQDLPNRREGVVWVRAHGRNQRGEAVVDYVRWLTVERRTSLSPIAPPRDPVIPTLAPTVPVEALHLPTGLDLRGYDTTLSGDTRRWHDYRPGERIDHVGGVTIEDAEHQLAARLYNSPARLHFDRRRAAGTPFGRRMAYSGHVVSVLRALSFEGLANAFRIAAVNAGRVLSPVGGGDTIYAWSEILDRFALPGRDDAGALRVRTRGVRDRACHDFPDQAADGFDRPGVVIDLDYTVLMPR